MADSVNLGRRGFLRGQFGGAASKPAGQGKAVVGDLCLARSGVECRMCADHCEVNAIRFSPRLGGPPIPEVIAGSCTGCGDCLPACPASAIRLA